MALPGVTMTESVQYPWHYLQCINEEEEIHYCYSTRRLVYSSWLTP